MKVSFTFVVSGRITFQLQSGRLLIDLLLPTGFKSPCMHATPKRTQRFVTGWVLCILMVVFSSRGQVISNQLWKYEWKTTTNSIGLRTVVQRFRRYNVGFFVERKRADAAGNTKDTPTKDGWKGRMDLILETGQIATNSTELCAKFARGWIYFSNNMAGPFDASSDGARKPATFVSSEDNTRVVIGVDDGPIFSSTNGGITWETITEPGKHSLAIVEGDAGCGLFAVQTIPNKMPPVPAATPNTNAPSTPEWYVEATGPDGTGTVAVGGGTQAVPVLGIFGAQGQVVISWPTASGNYILQQNSQLDNEHWRDIEVEPTSTNGYAVVTLPADPPHRFFRLRSP